MSMATSSITAELEQGRAVTYFTVGVSMRPLLIERATHVTVAPLAQANNGDILLYIRKSGDLVLHRCIKQNEHCYFMRGDNTFGLEKIAKAQAVGVVTYVFRKGRQIDVNRNSAYKLYVAVWRAIYPFRWVLQKFKSVLRRLKCSING